MTTVTRETVFGGIDSWCKESTFVEVNPDEALNDIAEALLSFDCEVSAEESDSGYTITLLQSVDAAVIYHVE